MIDAYASLKHYAHHLQPVWEALPDTVRGVFWCGDRDQPWGRVLDRTRDAARLTMVAGWRDAQTMAPSPLVLCEHGAGQAYFGSPESAGNGSYSGGEGLDAVRLFLCPSETVADRWRAVYPHAAVAVVGCPRLDRYLAAAHHDHDNDDNKDDQQQQFEAHSRDGTLPTVAVTFHADIPLCPETRSAWRHYDYKLPALCTDPRWRVLGHGHPRLWGAIRRRWQQLGVEHTADVDEVLARADLLVMDNTSLGFEAAAVGIPVLVLNMPAYRRNVHHGLRFWSHPPGLQIDRPDQLLAGVAHALTDPPVAQRLRHAAVAAAYSRTDGRSAEAAATAIMEVHGARSIREQGMASPSDW